MNRSMLTCGYIYFLSCISCLIYSTHYSYIVPLPWPFSFKVSKGPPVECCIFLPCSAAMRCVHYKLVLQIINSYPYRPRCLSRYIYNPARHSLHHVVPQTAIFFNPVHEVSYQDLLFTAQKSIWVRDYDPRYREFSKTKVVARVHCTVYSFP